MKTEVDRHKMSFSLLAMVPDIYSIDAEAEEKDHGDEEHLDMRMRTSDNIDIGKSLYNGQRLDVRPTTTDLTNTAAPNRRPLLRRHSSQGGPLKSSLQSSSSLVDMCFSRKQKQKSGTEDARRAAAAKESLWVRVKSKFRV